MKVLWTLILTALVLACSIFRDTTKSSSDAHQDASVFRFYRDSNGYEQEALIWPKGEFSYSAGIGFFGEAEKLVLKEKGRHVSLAVEQSKIHASNKEKAWVKEPKLDWILVLTSVVGIYLLFKFYKLWQL